MAFNVVSTCYATTGEGEPDTQPKIVNSTSFNSYDTGEPVLERQNAVANLARQHSLAPTVLVDPYSQDSSWMGSQGSQHFAAEGSKENPIDVG